ncbi:MAG: hypothetical protein A2931_00645 [Candidatus Niyogibacteria bacterium RIFCSPLOWO2_01_FULL_45_48]|uniref:alanine--tRNA ligase n=2 Tax=Candidatus Niyogiibacteriota TaxID=1817912 RepID=A0A1G2F244_9BACT|nr:MAG: hypothetical protein A2931_00645 [Candidatus Niyogibacteria bacterium RIFCSPLOWO2_01_FULL_45_48]OGZ30593.1 MAG: hypothetical protein A2835_01945 [Candidatus Niyogibacteria bacterium RIFCSPHIGHO2_01_FULL_45_28]OGZ31631.1 MAG: hypothetical protein A3J00_00255 [Candidatus Niyogibacteria bacterium RIFCSPLOWO2_02_FULL_45_13]
MISQEIREKFLEFFKKKGHAVVPSSSLIPDDPSVLFTTAGMQQFKPYYTGDADAMRDFGSLNTASIQKCLRTSDIDEVGDESHLTFFEMLGNFSFGGYFKKEAIEWGHEFITKEMGLKIDYVSVFGGEGNIPKDTESEKIWKSIDPKIKIKYAGRADNFWGPTGEEGPCGPTTEIYVNGLEIWNIVFNEFYCKKGGKLEPLKTPGIDTGMGLERLAMVSQEKSNIFETDLFKPHMSVLPEELPERIARIIGDHSRASVFLLTDGVRPSNKEQGYVLRRLMRRMLVYENLHGISRHIFDEVLFVIAKTYGADYPELLSKKEEIRGEFSEERERFSATLKKGIRELERRAKTGSINAKVAFDLYQTFGIPYEIVKELGGESADKLTREDFDKEFAKHQEISKAGQEKKFGGHGLILDTGELKAGSEEELKRVTRLHTATHLLQAALREVLGPEVRQMGSDITPERTRFDFSFNRKLTPEELKKISELVNGMIKADLSVKMKEMDYEDAVKSGALSFFKHKYPKRVKVYSVGEEGEEVSKEFCGGPHVSNTGEIGKLSIVKEEAVAAGVRRIRAKVENN